MKHMYLALIAMLMFAIGCSDSGLVAPDLSDSDSLVPELTTTTETTTAAKKATKYVPYKGSWSGYVDATVQLGVDCGELIFFPSTSEGVGSHAGFSTARTNHCLNPVTGEISNGYAEMTTASGDMIFWTYYGMADLTSPTGAWWANLEVVGGTGRFENATSRDMRHVGTGTMTEFWYDTTGWISTVGSSK